MSVAICRDDLWLEVKSQSNPEIAGSLRNPFRWSVIENSLGYYKDVDPFTNSITNSLTNQRLVFNTTQLCNTSSTM
jgi:hypothetical protein